MNEKVAINDVLAGLNSAITLCGYTIEQANNKNFRDIIIQKRKGIFLFPTSQKMVARKS